jgi:hypothetical protein
MKKAKARASQNTTPSSRGQQQKQQKVKSIDDSISLYKFKELLTRQSANSLRTNPTSFRNQEEQRH